MSHPNKTSTNDNLDFNEALTWAKKEINDKRHKQTSKFKIWYIVGGIIIILIIIFLLYLYYSRKKSTEPDPDASILDTMKEEKNSLPQASPMTPKPDVSQPSNSIPLKDVEQLARPSQSNSFSSLNQNQPINYQYPTLPPQVPVQRNPAPGGWAPSGPSIPPYQGSGGTYQPAISPNGNLEGWLYYPPTN